VSFKRRNLDVGKPVGITATIWVREAPGLNQSSNNGATEEGMHGRVRKHDES
jgi:hypothetical protein